MVSTPAPILNIPNAVNTPQSKDSPLNRPQGKAVPLMASSIADPFRQILPKDAKLQPSSSGALQANVRPMQIVGPIAAANSSGLVATVLPTPVQSQTMSNTILTHTTSTTTSITKIVTKESGKSKVESDKPVIINHVMMPQAPAIKPSYMEDKFSKSAKLENTVKEIQMKNTMSKSPAVSCPPVPIPRSSLSITKSKSMAEILNIPAHLNTSQHLKKLTEAEPIVTVTVKSKTGNKDQHVIKKPRDWKDWVQRPVSSSSGTVMSKSKSASSIVTPLKVPKPTFQYLDKEPAQQGKQSQNKLPLKAADNAVPTLHIPHTNDTVSSPPPLTGGHPGLPCGLQRTTSLLQHKSPTKMTLKEMRRIPSKVFSKPMSIITPSQVSSSDSSDSISDKPPQLSPQISLSKVRERSNSPGLSRSRLQLKPATSPKLNIEQYLTVSTDASKLLMGKPETPRTRRSGLLVDNSASSESSKSRTRPRSESPATQPSAEKKAKRESLSKKSSAPVLIPWSKRNKEPPKKSGGWSWKGDYFISKIYLNVSSH